MKPTLGRTALECLIKDGWAQFEPSCNYRTDTIERKDVFNGGTAPAYSVIFNPGRVNRLPPSKNGNGAIATAPESPALCAICTNNLCKCDLEKANIITKYADWYVLPNTFPIIKNHVVIIHNQLCPKSRSQDDVATVDLETLASYADDARQLVFYNSFGAGATVPHHHFQGISDYHSPLGEMRRTVLTPRVYVKEQMGIANYWTREPDAVVLLAKEFAREGRGFNIFVLPNAVPGKNIEFGIVPRNKAYEKGTHLGGSRVASLELNRGIVVSDREKYDALTYAGIDDDIKKACFEPAAVDPYVKKVLR